MRNICELIVTFLLLFGAALALAPEASAEACQPFSIYKGIKVPGPEGMFKNDTSDSVIDLALKVSTLPGHEKFSDFYLNSAKSQGFASASNERNYLICLLSYLQLDQDGDGLKDWKIASDQMMFSHLLPGDEDWDNDGITNLFDPEPLSPSVQVGPLHPRIIPIHLWLNSKKDSEINKLQTRILGECGVVALNHTDRHTVEHLQAFYDLCKISMRPNQKIYELVLYAFASHAYNSVQAAFYPESNFMSIAGVLGRRKAHKNIKMTIAHELGHYFIFNFLKPPELADIACQFTDLEAEEKGIESFFDESFLKSLTRKESGYFPSSYAYTNVHEWFSEVFAEYLFKRETGNADRQALSNLPTELELWISGRLDPSH